MSRQARFEKHWTARGAAVIAVGTFVACSASDDNEAEAPLPLINCSDAGNAGDAHLSSGDDDSAAIPQADSAADDASEGDASDAEPDGDDDAGDDAAPPPPPPANPDSDIALMRFNTNGTLDTTFGNGGVSVIDLGAGYVSGTTIVRDTATSVARDPQGRLVIFGGKKGSGVRVDLDRVVVRATANGALDATFGTSGVQTFNLANQDDRATGGLMQPLDGKIVSVGFTSQPTGVGTQVANRSVLVRLYDPGTTDKTFGVSGIVNSAPFISTDSQNVAWGSQEVYGLDRQSTGAYLTAGFGRTTSNGQYDLVAFRYTSTGAFDTTWGTKGIAKIDVAGDTDRGRNLLVLPDDRVLVVGSGTPIANVANVDAMTAILHADGTPDTTFNTSGYSLYELGGADEAFYGAALAPDHSSIAAVGYRAALPNDDAVLLLMPLAAGGKAIAKAIPLSTTDDDRLWSVAFDSAGMIYAAGSVATGLDSQIAVVRFDAIGTLDASFGAGGVAMVNVVPNGGTVETARALLIQPDGKIVVVGDVEHL